MPERQRRRRRQQEGRIHRRIGVSGGRERAPEASHVGGDRRFGCGTDGREWRERRERRSQPSIVGPADADAGVGIACRGRREGVSNVREGVRSDAVETRARVTVRVRVLGERSR